MLARALMRAGLCLISSFWFTTGISSAQQLPTGLRDIPRERTLIAAVDGGRGKLYDIWSTYNLGGNHQNGNSLFL